MKHFGRIFFSFFLMLSGNTFAANFADCILEKMPGTANPAATFAVYSVCSKSNPKEYLEIQKGSGRGFFGILGFSDSESCTIKKSRETSQVNAAYQIARACQCLYDGPAFEGQACEYLPQTGNSQVTFEPLTGPVEVASAPVVKQSPAPLKKQVSPSRPIEFNGSSNNDQQVKADLKRITERAFADYPYLNTPAGAAVLEKIIDRRDSLIQEGVYPSIAMTRAVNAFAPGNAP